MESLLDNSNVSKHLGKTSGYKSTYDASLLVREPRQSNRTHLGLTDASLPFTGVDIWNAYEVSCLLDNGTPVAAYAKIVYPCSNKYIVESKSIKLYLNSFNMQQMGIDGVSALSNLQVVISHDLSKLLETEVEVQVYDASDLTTKHQHPIDTFASEGVYKTLEKIVDTSTLLCTKYTETPELIKYLPSTTQVLQTYHSALLKSNCRVTNQPDWGDVFIHFASDRVIDPASLLQYIVSFRGENHFHEEIVETIYKRLHDTLKPTQLLVQALYVRRGGIDINPVRASDYRLIYDLLICPRSGCFQTSRQ